MSGAETEWAQEVTGAELRRSHVSCVGLDSRKLWFVSGKLPAQAFPYLAPLLRNHYCLPQECPLCWAGPGRATTDLCAQTLCFRMFADFFFKKKSKTNKKEEFTLPILANKNAHFG